MTVPGVGGRPLSAQNFELEKLRMEHNQKLMSDALKYVAEDLRTQLLLVALGGTSIAAMLAAYQSYLDDAHDCPEGYHYDSSVKACVKDDDSSDIKPVINVLPWWAWVISPAVTGNLQSAELLSGGLLFKTKDDTGLIDLGAGDTSTLYGLAGALFGAATSVAGLAWAALYMSILMGEGGMGGLLNKAGGGGFGAVAGSAMI